MIVTILLLCVVLLLASAVERPAPRNTRRAELTFRYRSSIPHARAAGAPTGRSFFWSKPSYWDPARNDPC